MAVTRQFTMPDIGEGLTEADILTWRVEVGDVVAVNDVIVEVETAKAVVELPSPCAGVVAAIHYAEGVTVEVGSVIIEFASAINGFPARAPIDPASPSLVAPAGDPEPNRRTDVLVGYGPTKARVARRPRRDTYRPPSASKVRDEGESARPEATPPVRKLARELGVALSTVTPSGARGQITREDLANGSRPVPGIETTESTSAQTRRPIKGVRKLTAEAMVSSAFTAPHVTEWVAVDMTRSVRLLERMRTDVDFSGVRLSPLVLVARAVILALTRHPEANAQWDSQSEEIVQYADVNLGIAAATPRGLVVPNIKSAQKLSTKELADALTALITLAREGKTPPHAMRGGTVTITNIGVFGVDGGTPILNPGEAAIVCMGQLRQQPWEHKGKVRLRTVSTLAISFDHRLIDGELGSRLLRDMAHVLEDPSVAFTW